MATGSSSASARTSAAAAALDPRSAQADSNRLLSDMAPHLMTPAMVNALARVSLGVGTSARDPLPLQRATLLVAPRFSMDNPMRSLARISSSLLQFVGLARAGASERGQERVPVTSMDIGVLEESQRLIAHANEDLDGALDTSMLDAAREPAAPPGAAAITDGGAPDGLVSLLRGYKATVPSASASKARRRALRASEYARKKNQTHRVLSLEELEAQDSEMGDEKQNIEIRRALYHAEMLQVDAKIAVLEATKAQLQQALLQLREEELELEDERTSLADTDNGLSELLELQRHRRAMPGGRGLDAATVAPARSSRRSKGPVFLPSEHDELPAHVAFMSLPLRTGAVTCLDFSEPYGTLVTGAVDDAARVWDLSTGEEVGRLRGHTDTVRCLQIEDEVCVTGGADHTVRVHDLTRVDAYEAAVRARGPGEELDAEEVCVRTLSGHSRAVTALYFDGPVLVTGADDKTLRHWDLTTGQCVTTMDLLWALSNPASSVDVRPTLDAAAAAPHDPLHAYTGPFAYAQPPYEDGSWEMYTDFVGGVQFWNYALASGSGDGGVRLWDCTYHALTPQCGPGRRTARCWGTRRL